MAAADTAKLIASLQLVDKFTKPLAGAVKGLNAFDKKLGQTESRAFKAGQQIGTGIKNGLKIAAIGVGLLTTQVLAGLGQLARLESVTKATNAVLTSTKAVAGQTAAGIRALSERLENLNATIDDKVIQSGANMLLTFTNIRKEAFEPALLAALNLNEAMGGGEESLQGNIIKVGKALNDPTKGLLALSRVGVKFTDQQKEQIKTLQESGDLLGAQNVIIKELGTEFGGRFKTQGATAEGAIAGIGDAVEDLQKGLATALFPTIQKLLPRFRELLSSPAFTTGVAKLGQAIGDLFSESNIAEGSRLLQGAFDAAKDAAPVLQAAAEQVGRIVGTAVDVFKSLPPELQALAVAGIAINKLTGGLVTNIAGGLISAVISSFKGLMNVNAAVVNVNGAVTGGVPGGLPAGAAGVGAGAAAGGVGTVIGLAALAAVAAYDKNAQEFMNKGLTEAEIRAIKWARMDEQTRQQSRNRGFGEQANQEALLASALKKLNPVIDRSQDSIEKMRGAVDFGAMATEANTNAVKGNTAAVKLSRSELRSIFAASGAARGVVNTPGASTSLKPRLGFLAGSASGSKDLAVARSLATLFEQSNAPLYRNTGNLVTTIKALKADQRQLLKHGDTRNAALIGAEIKRMKAELARRQAATTKAVRDKDLNVKVSVPVSVKQFINGRLIEAATGRFTSTIVGSRGGFREFG